MSVFSAATLRQYDTTTVPCPKYPYAYVCVFSCDTTTVRHHPLLYIVNLYFLQRHYDSATPLTKYSKSIFPSATLRHYDSTTPHLNIYIVSLYFLQRHCDSTTPPLTIYSKSMFSLATLRQYDATPYYIYMVSLYFLQ